MTQERPAHYIALPWKEEEQRRSNRQPPAAARGRATARVPRRHGWRSGEGARAGHGCPAAHSPASERPIDLPQGAQRSAESPWGDVGGRGSSGTGRAQRRRCLPLCPLGGGSVRQGAASVRARCRADGGPERGLAAQRVRGGSPAAAGYQPRHRPRRQEDAGHCCQPHTPRKETGSSAECLPPLEAAPRLREVYAVRRHHEH